MSTYGLVGHGDDSHYVVPGVYQFLQGGNGKIGRPHVNNPQILLVHLRRLLFWGKDTTFSCNGCHFATFTCMDLCICPTYERVPWYIITEISVVLSEITWSADSIVCIFANIGSIML